MKRGLIEILDQILLENPIEIIDKDTIAITIETWDEKTETHKITRNDLQAYYEDYSGPKGLLCGVRQLGSIVGDWRYVDYIAEIADTIFSLLDKIPKNEIKRRIHGKNKRSTN